MELYNFFTEVISSEKEPEKVCELYECQKELEPICLSVQIILFTGITGEKRYSIIGQMYGADTNVGDTDLFRIFSQSEIEYTWFDAYFPRINNINE